MLCCPSWAVLARNSICFVRTLRRSCLALRFCRLSGVLESSVVLVFKLLIFGKHLVDAKRNKFGAASGAPCFLAAFFDERFAVFLLLRGGKRNFECLTRRRTDLLIFSILSSRSMSGLTASHVSAAKKHSASIRVWWRSIVSPRSQQTKNAFSQSTSPVNHGRGEMSVVQCG